MASRLTLTDCDSVPGKDKLKPRMAANLIQQMADAEVELPGSVPKLSLMTRAVTCNTKIKDRLVLLRRLKEPVTEVLQAMHAKKIGITLPIAQEDVKLLGAVDGLLRDLIRGYNSVIEEARGSVGVLKAASKSQYAEACYGSIVFQTRRLLLSYESYRPVRKGIWSQIHLVYRIAYENGVEAIPLQVERPENKHESSIAHVYKRAILIGRSDPYHFSFRGVTRLFESLEKWPAMVSLTKKEAVSENNKSMFIIDLNSDFPAAPYFQSTTETKNGNFLILDTSELMERLNNELKAVMHNIASGLKGITQVQNFERMEILRHIVVSWGMHPVRKTKREDVGRDCKIVFGLTNVFSILHPDLVKDGSNEVDFDSTAEIQMVLGVFQERFGKVIDKNSFLSSWKIGNESSGGYSLTHTNSSTKELRVGDVLALKKKEENFWNICVVRWAMEDEDGQLQAGVFKIGTDAMPISMKPLESNKEFLRLEYTAALHIPEAKSFTNTDLIIAQKTVYSPNRTLYMRRGDNDRLVVATSLVVSSRSVDVFCYRFDVKDHQRPVSHQDSLRFKQLD